MSISALDKATAKLGALTVQELRELQTIIADMLAASNFDGMGSKPDGAKGYFETKFIPDNKRGKKYGPYLYLRKWEDGVLTSKYLGKAPGCAEKR